MAAFLIFDLDDVAAKNPEHRLGLVSDLELGPRLEESADIVAREMRERQEPERVGIARLLRERALADADRLVRLVEHPERMAEVDQRAVVFGSDLDRAQVRLHRAGEVALLEVRRAQEKIRVL